MAKIVLIETVFPGYRLALFRALKERWGQDLVLACGRESFSRTLCTPPEASGVVDVTLENKFSLGRRLLWQSEVNRLARRADLVIVEFNLRAPSTWWLLKQRRRVGLPTIFWGHAAGSHAASGPIRRWMLRRASGFIAYMPEEQQKLQREFQRLPVWVAPNATMWARECWFLSRSLAEVVDVIYVGRMVIEKKVRLLLEGFIIACQRELVPSLSRLILIGDGPERAALQQRAQAAGLGARVVFPGHLEEVEQLRNWYAGAAIAVSPGPVGLAATQALSFGVPMLVADGERHGPEFELCQKGVNSKLFQANNAESLVASFGEMMRDRPTWVGRRSEICARIRSSYSFDKMVETFEQVIKTDFGGSRADSV